MLLVIGLGTTAADSDWVTTGWLAAAVVICATGSVLSATVMLGVGRRVDRGLLFGPLAFTLVFSRAVRRDLSNASRPSTPTGAPPTEPAQPRAGSQEGGSRSDVRGTSVAAVAGRVVLAGLLFPLLLVAWLVIAAIAGDESFTEGAVRGGIVATAVIAGVAILIVAARWVNRARKLAPGERSRRLRVGGLTAVVVLGLIGAGAGALLRVVGHGPVSLARPTIRGTARVGETLTASPGQWNPRGNSQLEFEYFWYRCRGEDCVELAADGKSYRLEQADMGARISVSVLAFGDLNATADSAQTSAIRAMQPPRGVIAFTHSLHDTTVYVLDEKGQEPRRLLQQDGPVYEAVDSPDGRQIAFVSNRDGSGEIYVMEADRTQRRQLTHTSSFNIDPAWSPDGRRIVFSSARDGNPEIYVMNSDGSDPRRLTHNANRDENPVWSPDRRMIAFWSDRDGNDELYVMRSDGGNEARLTNNQADDDFPAWSPDGSTLAFTSERDGNAELYLIRLRDRSVTRLTRDPAWDGSPSWSPDGNRLAFVSDRDGDEDICRGEYRWGHPRRRFRSQPHAPAPWQGLGPGTRLVAA
jgi:WD40-like Beta Propeller Repeat